MKESKLKDRWTLWNPELLIEQKTPLTYPKMTSELSGLSKWVFFLKIWKISMKRGSFNFKLLSFRHFVCKLLLRSTFCHTSEAKVSKWFFIFIWKRSITQHRWATQVSGYHFVETLWKFSLLWLIYLLKPILRKCF